MRLINIWELQVVLTHFVDWEFVHGASIIIVAQIWPGRIAPRISVCYNFQLALAEIYFISLFLYWRIRILLYNMKVLILFYFLLFFQEFFSHGNFWLTIPLMLWNSHFIIQRFIWNLFCQRISLWILVGHVWNFIKLLFFIRIFYVAIWIV